MSAQINTVLLKLIKEAQKNRTQIKANKAKSIANATNIQQQLALLNKLNGIHIAVQQGTAPTTLGTFIGSLVEQGLLTQELAKYATLIAFNDLVAKVASLEAKGTYRGTFATLDAGKAGVSNPAKGDVILVGASAPFQEYIYEPTKPEADRWEQAGVSSSFSLSRDAVLNVLGVDAQALADLQANHATWLKAHQSLASYITKAVADQTYVPKTDFIVDDTELNALIGDAI